MIYECNFSLEQHVLIDDTKLVGTVTEIILCGESDYPHILYKVNVWINDERFVYTLEEYQLSEKPKEKRCVI